MTAPVLMRARAATRAGGRLRARLANVRVVKRFLAGGRWRTTGAVALAVVVVLAGYEKVVVEVMHAQRQDARVSQFTASATSSTVAFGDPIALVQIPAIGVNTVIAEGESHATLRAGPVHRETSALPGTPGNAVIAGKHRRYGAPFARLAELNADDDIVIKTRSGQPVRYRVTEVLRGADVDEAEVFAPGDEALLTLVTTAGFFGGEQIVVQAVAAPDSVLEAAISLPVTGAPSTDAVSAADLLVVALWLAGSVVIGRLALIVLRGRWNWTSALVIVPVFAIAALELALALERLLPATV